MEAKGEEEARRGATPDSPRQLSCHCLVPAGERLNPPQQQPQQRCKHMKVCSRRQCAGRPSRSGSLWPLAALLLPLCLALCPPLPARRGLPQQRSLCGVVKEGGPSYGLVSHAGLGGGC